MSGKVPLLVAVALTLGAAAYSAVLYPQLPDRMPIHWNIRGEVDGYSGKAAGLFLMPGIMVFLLGMWVILPGLSPQNFRVATFRQTWDYVMLLSAGMMVFCHVVIIQAGLHPGLDLGKILTSGIFAFLALLGGAMGKVKRNFWMGYRTPWTLANEKVWDETHQFAAKTLVVAGIVGVIAIWSGVPMAICMALFIVGALLPLVQSLIVYKQLEKKGEL
jgi:uncharacterized membrane protein